MTEDQGKVAVVTGAAGGIGSAITRALADKGEMVAALDRDKRELDSIAAMPGRIVPFTIDIRDRGQVESAIAEIETRMGPINQLVNAAGILRPGRVDTYLDEDWDDSFAINARGTFLVSRAVTRRMIPRGAGAIVTISSNAAATPRTGMAAYAASKAAAAMITKCLGLEVARYGIRCNVVAPGSTDTPMLRLLWKGEDGKRGAIQGSPEEFKLGIPLAKIANPEEIANGVLFLLSDAASHITLETITIDGGATLGS